MDNVEKYLNEEQLNEKSNIKVKSSTFATGDISMRLKTPKYKDVVIVCEYPSMAKSLEEILKYCTRIE